jgi:hypothetical protein
MACLLGLVAACGTEETAGSGTGNEEEPFVLPATVAINVESAVIRPWDDANELWDDSQQVSQEEISALMELLGTPEPYAEIAGMVAELGIDHWAPPDPYGFAEVFVDGTWRERLVVVDDMQNFDNTFAPTFAMRPGWSDLALNEELRVAVSLTDEDDLLTGEDDPIGTVVIDYDDIVAALKQGGVYQVPTHDQGTGTILFVGISVAG